MPLKFTGMGVQFSAEHAPLSMEKLSVIILQKEENKGYQHRRPGGGIVLGKWEKQVFSTGSDTHWVSDCMLR